MFSAPRSRRPKSSSGASSFAPLRSYSRPTASSRPFPSTSRKNRPAVQGLGDVLGDRLGQPRTCLADCGRLGPVVAGNRIHGDDPAVRRGQRGESRDQRIGHLPGLQLVRRGQPRGDGFGPGPAEIFALTVHSGSCYPCLAGLCLRDLSSHAARAHKLALARWWPRWWPRWVWQRYGDRRMAAAPIRPGVPAAAPWGEAAVTYGAPGRGGAAARPKRERPGPSLCRASVDRHDDHYYYESALSL